MEEPVVEDSMDDGGCALYNSVLEGMPACPPCRILPVPGKGVGMVAQRKLYPGDLILAEAPLLFVPDSLDQEATNELLEETVCRMTRTQREVLLCLSDCRNPSEPGNLGRYYTNAMSYEDDAVLCPIMARANHSCRPNAEFVARKDLGVLHLRAMYVIEEGEEVAINYMLMEEEGGDRRDVRQAYLRKWYGFQCLCQSCTLQDEEFLADEALRRSLKEAQSRGVESLGQEEADMFLAGMYAIQAKLSYISSVVERCFQSCTHPVRLAVHVLHGRSLAVQLYGEHTQQAALWEERASLPAANHAISWAEGCIFK